MKPSIRQLMLTVCVIGLAVACLRLAISVWTAVDDTYYVGSDGRFQSAGKWGNRRTSS